jgi:hypothetical protein
MNAHRLWHTNGNTPLHHYYFLTYVYVRLCAHGMNAWSHHSNAFTLDFCVLFFDTWFHHLLTLEFDHCRAAFGGHIETVRVLLQCGADACVRNTDDCTAADLADLRNHNEVAALLRHTVGEDKQEALEDDAAQGELEADDDSQDEA